MERVMVVDDEPDIVNWACKAIERLGYVVKGHTDPAAALEELKRAPDQCQLVILDQVMPGIPGPMLVEEIRRFRPDMPIIMWSGNQDLIPAGTGEQIERVLPKPVNVQELANEMRKVLHSKPQ